MPVPSEDLLKAVYGLRKAAEAEFQGNTYYKIANEIDGLLELLGWGAGIQAGKDAAYGFASMLADVRKAARASLFANDYYRIAHKLELLSSFLAPSQEAPKTKSEAPAAQAAASAPPIQVPAPVRPSFDDLAAASKARVEGVAQGFGIISAHRAEVPHREPERISADGELERRSSEPCSMAELAPVIVEPVAAAAISAETIAMPHAKRRVESLSSDAFSQGVAAVEPTSVPAEIAALPGAQQAPLHLGSPPAQSEAGEEVRLTEIAAKKIAAEAPAAGAKGEEPKRERPKTLFRLWLDLAFGRRR